MPRHDLNDLAIAPGFFSEQSGRGARNRWKNGNLVRFQNGLPERWGGWQKAIPTQFLGICRGLHDWQTLSLQKVVGMGTHLKLYLVYGGALYDITPLETSGTLTDPFTTTNGSAIVNVEHVANNRNAGDYVHYSGAAAVGGITIDGEYTVTAVVDTDNYTITHSSPASSDAGPGGGSVGYEYEIHAGRASTTTGLGWGAGSWGSGTWGTPRTTSSFLFDPRTWSLDNWGEDLMANPRDGGIYIWDAGAVSPFDQRATVLTNAPATAKFIIMSPVDRHLIAFGAHDGTASDPMLIRWCDQENNTQWTPTDTNTAGDKRLDVGSEILCAERLAREFAVFTDVALYSMYPVGPPDTFGFRQIGEESSIRGPHTPVAYRGRVFWMGDDEFYVYDGQINVLPCDVHNHVFKDINNQHRHKVYGALLPDPHNELIWVYPAAGSTECDRYVIFNPTERAWYFGTLSRSAWHKSSGVFNSPYATGDDGYLYVHETGEQADGEDSMGEFIESWDIEEGSGSQLVEGQRYVPDFLTLNGSVTLTVNAKKYPHSSITKTKGPYTITSTTEKLGFRIRGRQISFRVDGVTGHWRMGTQRTAGKGHGRR